MTIEQAKEVLALYRGTPLDAQDAEVKEALALARSNPELQAWLDAQLAFHSGLRQKMRSLSPPPGLKEKLLARGKIVEPPIAWWRQPLRIAVAAVLLFSGIIFAVLLQPGGTHDRFAQFQSRMVGTALRQYRMDILTNDMSQVRTFMASRGAPADYTIPDKLERLQLTGGGALKWRNNPVAMVCFDRGDRQMLYLFVTDRRAIKDAPKETIKVEQVSDLLAVSWSEGDKTYLLAGPVEPDFTRKYVQ